MKNEHIVKRPGVRKVKLARSEEDAKHYAEMVNNIGKIRINAYECSVCHAWHIGTYSKRTAMRAAIANDPMRFELGSRAYSNLAVENFGNRKSRMQHILNLAARASERNAPAEEERVSKSTLRKRQISQHTNKVSE